MAATFAWNPLRVSRRTARFVVLNPVCEDWGVVNGLEYLSFVVRGVTSRWFISSHLCCAFRTNSTVENLASATYSVCNVQLDTQGQAKVLWPARYWFDADEDGVCQTPMF